MSRDGNTQKVVVLHPHTQRASVGWTILAGFARTVEVIASIVTFTVLAVIGLYVFLMAGLAGLVLYTIAAYLLNRKIDRVIA